MNSRNNPPSFVPRFAPLLIPNCQPLTFFIIILATTSALGILTQDQQATCQAQDPSKKANALQTNGWEFIATPTDSPLKEKNLSWKSVELPSTFEEHEGVSFDGIGWYRTHLTNGLNTSPHTRTIHTRTIVRLHGAATEATLWCNGEKIAEHLGGWTPFECDVTRFLNNSSPLSAESDHPKPQAELLIKVDERVGHNSQGFLPVFAPHFGGLWKPIEVLELPPVWIDPHSLFLWGDPSNSNLNYEITLHGLDQRAIADFLPEYPFEIHLDYRLKSHPSSARTPEGDDAREKPASWTRLSIPYSDDDGKRLLEKGTLLLQGQIPIADPKLWSPEQPNLYETKLSLTLKNAPDTQPIHQHSSTAAFRSIRVQADSILLNEKPLQVRGILNWGYAPPRVAPSLDPKHWREELQFAKDNGFNLMKICLWIPPKGYLELADEMGVLLWMEYPTWHSQWTQAALPTLEKEFDEFFLYDRSHPSVILRSLTCETGPSADIEVLRTLYDRCHRRIPGSIVEDDSSWIQWNRIHDFYDDHPYGNNHTWLATLERLRSYIAEHGVKPLVLGEAIAADTWCPPNSLESMSQSLGDQALSLQSVKRGTPESGYESPFWFPLAYRANESWAQARSIDMGKPAVQRLETDSKRYAWLMRKYQIETYRHEFPNGGYVVSVIRDFPFASMGLLDFENRPKWPAQSFRWHSEHALVLRTNDERRSFFEDAPFEANLILQSPNFYRDLQDQTAHLDATQSTDEYTLEWTWSNPDHPSITGKRRFSKTQLENLLSSDPPKSLTLLPLHSLKDQLPKIPNTKDYNGNAQGNVQGNGPEKEPVKWNLQVQFSSWYVEKASPYLKQQRILANNNWDLWQIPATSQNRSTTTGLNTAIELHSSCSEQTRKELAALCRVFNWPQPTLQPQPMLQPEQPKQPDSLSEPATPEKANSEKANSEKATPAKANPEKDSANRSAPDRNQPIIVAQRFDAPLLNALELGRNVLFIPDGQQASLPLTQHWFLRGGPIIDSISRWNRSHDLIVDLQHFDLAGPVVSDVQWLEQCTPLVMLWDNHDIPKVKTHGLIFATRIDQGTLLVNTLLVNTLLDNRRLDNNSQKSESTNPARAWILSESINYLQTANDSAQRGSEAAENRIGSLTPESLQGIRYALRQKTLSLKTSRWIFRPDPKNQGLELGWHLPDLPMPEIQLTPSEPPEQIEAPSQNNQWKPIEIGKHWESEGYPGLDGWAWYRTEVTVPPDWEGEELHLWVDGADDYIEVYVDGVNIGSAGERSTRKTAFEELASFAIPKNGPDTSLDGSNGLPADAVAQSPKPRVLKIAIRVEDWQGAGGLFRPISLANTPRTNTPILAR